MLGSTPAPLDRRPGWPEALDRGDVSGFRARIEPTVELSRHVFAAPTIYLDQADSDTGLTPDVADATISAEDSMLGRERMSAIRQHVMALPERQRMAVLMHKYEGMDYKQIGDVLKLSESATKSLLFRAYQTLREKLKEFI